jgi:hypothetical protein
MNGALLERAAGDDHRPRPFVKSAADKSVAASAPVRG